MWRCDLLLASIFYLPCLAASSLHAAPCPAVAVLIDRPEASQRRCHGCHKELHVTEGQETYTPVNREKGWPLLSADRHYTLIPGLSLSPAGRHLVLKGCISSVGPQSGMNGWTPVYPTHKHTHTTYTAHIHKHATSVAFLALSANFYCPFICLWVTV